MTLLLSLIVIVLIIIIITYRKEKESFKTALEEEKKIKETINFKRKLNHDLNNKEIWMVDYENTHYMPDILKENSENVICYVFAASFQKASLMKKLEQYKGKTIIETVFTSRNLKNLNDLKIALYIGIIETNFRPSKIIIDSNDRDFSALFAALNDLGIHNIELFQGDKKTKKDRQAIGAYYKIRNILKYPKTVSEKNFRRYMLTCLHIDDHTADMIIKRLEQLGYIEYIDNRYYKEIKFKK
ncbi:MAG: PIN domain-containing protein [Erysipelotrichaceae bacterium]